MNSIDSVHRQLSTIDISEPTNPQQVGGYDTGGCAWGVTVSDGYAYVADYRGRLRVMDISSPASPWPVGGYDLSGGASVRAASGDYIYVAGGEDGLRILAVRTLLRIPPSSLQVISGDQFGFRVSSEPGQPLEIQASEDLETWRTIGTLTNQLGSTDLIDPMNGQDRRFYWLRLKE